MARGRGPTLRSPRSHGAELVLALALLSAAALLWVALVAPGDLSQAGENALARRSGEVAEAVLREWEIVRRDPGLFDGDVAPVFTYATEPGAAELGATEPGAANPPLAASAPQERTVSTRAFDALMNEARRLELEARDPSGALDAALDALVQEVDPERRAGGRLYGIQLALACERTDVAREQWLAAKDEASGVETSAGTSTLLLAAIAAAPALSQDEARAAFEQVADLWANGGLVLPTADPLDPASARRASLRERLEALAGGKEPRLAAAEDAARAQSLAARFGVLPIPDEPGLACVLVGGDGELVARTTIAASVIEGAFLPAGTLRARLERSLAAQGVVAAGFAVDLAGDDDASGAIVRARTPLPGALAGELGFVLRHVRPGSVRAAEEQRVLVLRAAFGVLALFVAGAGFLGARALARERRLAELKSRFVANVSHELRTPLASILLLAENLEQGRVEGDEARARYHGLIRREAERLRRLVDDVLDFSRLERGKSPELALAPIDAAAFAARVEREAGALAAHAGRSLSVVQSGLPKTIEGDADALARAVQNLVENALKHGGGAVELALAGDGAQGLVIGVRDHGSGVPRSARKRIFEPFDRGDRAAHGERTERSERGGQSSNASAAPTPGAGLGLAIVREIAHAHGGEVELVDLPDDMGHAGDAGGEGALFQIRLPARTIHEGDGARE